MKGNLNLIFGELLRELRLERKLTQEQLSENSGLDRAYISELERGLLLPSLETFFRIAYALNMAPADLITRIENKLKP